MIKTLYKQRQELFYLLVSPPLNPLQPAPDPVTAPLRNPIIPITTTTHCCTLIIQIVVLVGVSGIGGALVVEFEGHPGYPLTKLHKKQVRVLRTVELLVEDRHH